MQSRLSEGGWLLRSDALAFAACIALAIGFSAEAFWSWPRPRLSYDMYGAHYPNIVYALRALEDGHGLLWNRLQNCGQPYLPNTLAGVLYPFHLLFLLVDIDVGFMLMAMIHLAITGIAMYLLCREMGLGRIPSLCGALAWEISKHVVQLAGWQPTSILGVYVWMPAAMLFTERILRRPALLPAIALGVVLTLQVLPGYPQILFFTYLLIGLRVFWELLTSFPPQPVRTLGFFAIGLVIPPFLGAAALFPMSEFADVSIRNKTLTGAELNPRSKWTWQIFRNQIPRGFHMGTPLALMPLLLGVQGLAGERTRRLSIFYVLVAVLSITLVFDNPIGNLYRALPLGSIFRDPGRFLWVAGFALSILPALGVEALGRAHASDRGGRRLSIPLGLAAVALLYLLSPIGLEWWEWSLAGVGMLVFVQLLWGRRAVIASRVVIVAMVVVNLWVANSRPVMGYLRNSDVVYLHRKAFDFVAGRMSYQDRIYLYGKHLDYALMPKSASVFGIPSIDDYEPQTSRRYAELLVMMLAGKEMSSINQFLYRTNRVPRVRKLFDLMAARYVLASSANPSIVSLRGASLKKLWSRLGVTVYENPLALPRAFFVPRVIVESDPRRLLSVLASPSFDVRRAALVEVAPEDGFLGETREESGEVKILSDHSEVVRVEVAASVSGFLFLSDQYYPGWEASVNGDQTPILRANYAFRAVRVPAGTSTVTFRYRPAAVYVGLIVSGLTAGIIAVAVWIVLRKETHRRTDVVATSHSGSGTPVHGGGSSHACRVL